MNKKKLLGILFFLLIGAIFVVNTFHDSYPDEFDNILGGRYILEGKVVYRDFFTHHGPVPYYLSSVIQQFSGQSFVRFRVFYSLFLLFLTFAGYFWLKRRFADKIAFYPFFIFVLGVSATYFWAHMLLADSLSGFLFAPAYLLVFLSSFYGRKLATRDMIIISIFLSLILLSSLTYSYLLAGFYLASVFLYLKGQKIIRPIVLVKTLAIFITPYILFAGYLLVSNSLVDYIQQNIDFNARYYIYNYPRPEGSSRINPLRFAIIITKDFYGAFTGLLINSKDFNLAFPFNSALAVFNTALFFVLIFARRFFLASFLLFTLIFANTRSNPLTSRETDYQSAVYIMVSLINCGFVLPYIYQKINQNVVFGKKIIFSFLLLFVSIYAFFGFIFVFSRFSDKVFGKYMGKVPLIYDRPQLSPIVNKLISDDDYMWIGPFEFEELFYAKGKVPSKYHLLIPGMGKSAEIMNEMIADFGKNKPKVIMFDRRFFILGQSPEMFAGSFLDFLAKEYITLFDYRDGETQYVSILSITERVDLETKLYIDKDRVNEVIPVLLQENLIRLK